MRRVLIADWREAWRFSSLWIGSLAIAVLTAWDMLPAELRDALLDRYKLEIGIVMWVALLASRITRQPWSQAAIDAKRAAAANDAAESEARDEAR
jgi:hypothetical protein